MPSFFDNINSKVVDDLKVSIKDGSKLSIASACFSIYAFEELKRYGLSLEELNDYFDVYTQRVDRLEKRSLLDALSLLPRLSFKMPKPNSVGSFIFRVSIENVHCMVHSLR